ncbi:hypothetical protein Purlil1_13086 [Purpureocillium lilacinum]|uniref:Uncharacterized protein n=1 Tax=Purpureocillium lilacinum TaxID=33203 RepID=A0ABR0BF24_PURLI|nr:hypothetical protein Purlil1_13086 [Purpureocillium lilacinum]
MAKELGESTVMKYDAMTDRLVIAKVAGEKMLPTDLYSKWDDASVEPATMPKESSTDAAEAAELEPSGGTSAVSIATPPTGSGRSSGQTGTDLSKERTDAPFLDAIACSNAQFFPSRVRLLYLRRFRSNDAVHYPLPTMAVAYMPDACRAYHYSRGDAILSLPRGVAGLITTSGRNESDPLI